MVLIPVGLWLTRSTRLRWASCRMGWIQLAENMPTVDSPTQIGAKAAILTANFWLIMLGATLVIGAINAVIQNYVLFLKDQGYSTATASHFMSALLAASLWWQGGGRLYCGPLQKEEHHGVVLFAAWRLDSIACLLHTSGCSMGICGMAFGFAMGADYMLIPLVTAECFGIGSLAKILALIISGYSVGQWVAPWAAGRLFDVYHSYNLAWGMITAAAVLGAGAIYAVTVPSGRGSPA
jgi:MFS family permease